MNKLTWKQFRALAMKHYNNGGDAVIECWNESDYDEVGHMTEAEALEMFSDRDEIIRDIEADAAMYRGEAIEATQDATDEEPDEYDEPDDTSEWRPGDAPWNAPGMNVSDFIR